MKGEKGIPKSEELGREGEKEGRNEWEEWRKENGGLSPVALKAMAGFQWVINSQKYYKEDTNLSEEWWGKGSSLLHPTK